MKVLITGGAGFIGSYITDSLIEADYDVSIIDDLSTGHRRNINPAAKFYKLDIQSPELKTVFEKEKPEFVCHQAAQKDVRLSVSDPVLDAKINVLGTINLLQNCLQYKVKKVVFASSGGAIYGEQDIFPAPETHPTRPISPYGITKLVAEHYMYYYKVIHGLDYVSLRYSNVYGPRQDPHGEAGVVAIFIQKMLNGGAPVINGDGEQTRDFIYVNDVARANLMAIEGGYTENIFNIGTSVETSVNQIFNHLVEIIDPAIKRKHGPAKEGEQMRSVVDCARAKKSMNWHPHTALVDGLKETVDFFSNELHYR